MQTLYLSFFLGFPSLKLALFYLSIATVVARSLERLDSVRRFFVTYSYNQLQLS